MSDMIIRWSVAADSEREVWWVFGEFLGLRSYNAEANHLMAFPPAIRRTVIYGCDRTALDRARFVVGALDYKFTGDVLLPYATPLVGGSEEDALNILSSGVENVRGWYEAGKHLRAKIREGLADG